ncbi:MAG: fimbrial protein [Stenotrophomonas sp.]|uniref:fimbrial protein n=1 Tax=Stenotrophomonas sp. TaxID=69392 RepID=UPI003D6C8FAC
MRKITLLSILMLAVAPMAASAADGTITFTGKITDKTCDITTGAGKDFTVPLPTVSTSSLAAAGAVAARTPFAINLSQCSPGQVGTYFESGTTVDQSSGRLNNQLTTNAAGNVQIQLVGGNGNALPVLLAQPNSQMVTVDGDGNATLNYFAEYYATAAATAGDLSTSVQYTIIYN